MCGMSVDYYSRLEQQRGPLPSEQMLSAIARGLHLSLDERDHLFRLGGYATPRRIPRTDHVNAGLMRVLDRLADTPAQVMSGTGDTLVQTPMAAALFGDETRFEGLARSVYFRWFTDSRSREVYPQEDHELHGRMFAADLRTAYARDGQGSRAAEIVESLVAVSDEFRQLWAGHEVGLRRSEQKRLVHPEVGDIDVHCQVLHDVEQGQVLLVFTATPGTESHEKLKMLSVLGARHT
jgi:transcriptional regulator with XRE-family HTH domain